MAIEAARAGVVKRSLAIAGHRTSISLEDAFWRRLQAIAASRGVPVSRIVADVDAGRGGANLSSALRVFVLEAVSLAERQDSAETRPAEDRGAPGPAP